MNMSLHYTKNMANITEPGNLTRSTNLKNSSQLGQLDPQNKQPKHQPTFVTIECGCVCGNTSFNNFFGTLVKLNMEGGQAGRHKI